MRRKTSKENPAMNFHYDSWQLTQLLLMPGQAAGLYHSVQIKVLLISKVQHNFSASIEHFACRTFLYGNQSNLKQTNISCPETSTIHLQRKQIFITDIMYKTTESFLQIEEIHFEFRFELHAFTSIIAVIISDYLIPHQRKQD